MMVTWAQRQHLRWCKAVASGYIEKVELVGFADSLDVGCDEKRGHNSNVCLVDDGTVN